MYTDWTRYYKRLKESANSGGCAAAPAPRDYQICPKMKLPTVPFITWASIARSVYDFHAFSVTEIEILYGEYVSDLYYMGFEPQGAWIVDRIIDACSTTEKELQIRRMQK